MLNRKIRSFISRSIDRILIATLIVAAVIGIIAFIGVPVVNIAAAANHLLTHNPLTGFLSTNIIMTLAWFTSCAIGWPCLGHWMTKDDEAPDTFTSTGLDSDDTNSADSLHPSQICFLTGIGFVLIGLFGQYAWPMAGMLAEFSTTAILIPTALFSIIFLYGIAVGLFFTIFFVKYAKA